MMEATVAIQFRDEGQSLRYTIHPAAMLFPEMEGDQWNKFVVDIRDNGQLEPIIVHDGKVIDGRNRLRACRWLKIEPKVRQYQGREEDILSHVMSLNLARRHLTESQRAMMASKVANMRSGARTDLQPKANLPEVSNTQAAKLLNVSERSVKTAKQVVAKGQPEVAAAVESGKISLNEASKIVQLRPDKQKEIVELPKAERREALHGSGLENMDLHRVGDDHHHDDRFDLVEAFSLLANLKAPVEEIIRDCPKYAAPDINKLFGKAFMTMQAIHAAYQSWEYRNVHND